MAVTIPFDNSYARLPERFYARVSPAKVREPRIVKVNHALAEQLGLDPGELDSAAGAQVLAGNVVPDGAASIALAYAGHQFGGFRLSSVMVARSCWVR
jgi:serine/tyrosine/threonine adenylyltransferase